MTRHDPIVSLHQMLDHAREAADMARGRTRDDLDSDRLLNLALVRLLEIVGEAAGRIPSEQRDLWPSVPWRNVIGLRNRLVHGYDQVNFDILWAIVTNDLPPLIEELQKILDDGQED